MNDDGGETSHNITVCLLTARNNILPDFTMILGGNWKTLSELLRIKNRILTQLYIFTYITTYYLIVSIFMKEQNESSR